MPKPGVNLTRFHGVFVPNSTHRAQVTQAGRSKGATGQATAQTDPSTPAQRRAEMTWAQRLKRVFCIDIQTCAVCGGAMRIIACIEAPLVIEKILAHLDAKAAAAQAARPSRAPLRRAVRLRRSPQSGPFTSGFASCCAPLQAWAGDRLRAKADTVRIAARPSRVFTGRGGGGRDFTHPGSTRAPALPLLFALD